MEALKRNVSYQPTIHMVNCQVQLSSTPTPSTPTPTTEITYAKSTYNRSMSNVDYNLPIRLLAHLKRRVGP